LECRRCGKEKRNLRQAPLEDAESVAGTESSHGSSDGSEGHELKKNPRDPEDVGGNLAGQNAYMQLTMEEKMDIF